MKQRIGRGTEGTGARGTIVTTAQRSRALAGAAAFLLLTLFGPPLQADQATVYQCKQPDGTVVFSGKPCGPDAKQLTIEAPSAGSGGEEAMQGIRDMARQYDARMAQQRRDEARARQHQPSVVVVPKAESSSGLAVPGYLPYPLLGRPQHDRFDDHRDRHDHDHDHRPPPIPYKPPPQPGYSGRFPGGSPNYRGP